MTVRVPSKEERTNLTWLPSWLTSAKPAASKRRRTSRYGNGLSGKLNLHRLEHRQFRRERRLKMQVQRFAQVRERFRFRLALAGNIYFKALRHIPAFFLCEIRRQSFLHLFI